MNDTQGGAGPMRWFSLGPDQVRIELLTNMLFVQDGYACFLVSSGAGEWPVICGLSNGSLTEPFMVALSERNSSHEARTDAQDAPVQFPWWAKGAQEVPRINGEAKRQELFDSLCATHNIKPGFLA